MPRPRLTPEDLQARIGEYCARYKVEANSEGLPPFPAGQRESRQHREWIAVYKAHDRLARRARGQCERCEAPASHGVVFCERHRSGGDRGAELSVPERKSLLAAQDGRCPICSAKVGLRDSLEVAAGRGAFLHGRCARLVTLAQGLGPEGLERLRAFLWPQAAGKPRRP
jgi:hypothetical protein